MPGPDFSTLEEIKGPDFATLTPIGEVPGFEDLSANQPLRLNLQSGRVTPPGMTTSGGPRVPLASYAETAASLQEADTPLTRLIAPRPSPFEPRVSLPKVPIASDAGFWKAAGSEAVNALEGVPEFFTSDAGILSVLGARLSPRLVSAGFSADMTLSAFQQAKQAYQNWDKMTPAEKGKATVDILASTVLSGLTGAHAAGVKLPSLRRAEQPLITPPITGEALRQPAARGVPTSIGFEGEQVVPKAAELAPTEPPPVAPKPPAPEAEVAPAPAVVPARDWDLLYENLTDELDSFNPARSTGRINYELNDVAQRFVDYAKADKSGKPVNELVADFAKTDEASKGQISKLRQSVQSIIAQEQKVAPAPPAETGEGKAEVAPEAPSVAEIQAMRKTVQNSERKLRKMGAMVPPPIRAEVAAKVAEQRRKLDAMESARIQADKDFKEQQNKAADQWDKEQDVVVGKIQRGEKVTRAEIEKYFAPESHWRDLATERGLIQEEPAPTPPAAEAGKREGVALVSLKRRGYFDDESGATWKVQQNDAGKFYVEKTINGERTVESEAFNTIEEAQKAAVDRIAQKPLAKTDVESLLKSEVPDVTQQRQRVRAIDERQTELRDQYRKLEAEIKEIEKTIKPQRGSVYARSKIKASAKKSDVAKYRELQQQSVELDRQIGALDDAAKADRQAIDKAQDAEIISDKRVPLIRRLDRAYRSGESTNPALAKALSEETYRLLREKYPDITEDEMVRLAPEVQRSAYFANTIEQIWKDPNLPTPAHIRRAALDAAVNAPDVPKHLFPQELQEKLDRFRAADRRYGGKIAPGDPVEDLSAKDLADLKEEIRTTSDAIRSELKAKEELMARQKAEEEAKEAQLLGEAQAVADSAGKTGTKGGRSAKEVKADLVSRLKSALDEVIARDKTTVKIGEEGDITATSESGIAFGTVEPAKGGFKVTARNPANPDKSLTVTVKTREEAQWVVQAMASRSVGKAIIGVPGDGVFRLERSGPHLLGVWSDARKLEVTSGGGKAYTTSGGGETPPDSIKTEKQWREAKEYHGLEEGDKIHDWSPALLEVAKKVNPQHPEQVTVKQVDDFLERKKKEVTEPTPAAPAAGTKEGMPPEQSFGGALPSEFVPGQGRPSSIKNATVDRERRERGLDPMEPVMRREWGEVWDEAMAKIDADAGWQDRLISELVQKPRPITDTENAGLLQRRVDLRNEYDKAARDAAQAYKDGRIEDMEAARMRLAMWSDKLVELEQATGKGGAGTALGRGLNARRMMMNEDFSLAKLELDKRADNGFRPLTDAERAQLQKIADDWQKTSKDLEAKLARRDIELSEAQAQLELKRIALEAAQEPKYAPRVIQIAEGFAKKMDVRGNTAFSRIKEILATPGAFSGPLNPELIDQLAIYGAAKITRGAVDFAKWSDRMVRDLGDKIVPYLQAAWAKANSIFETEAAALEKEHGPSAKAARKKLSEMPREEQIGRLTSEIGKRVNDDQGKDISPIVQKLARIFVKEGTRDLKTLVQQLYSAILPFASELTERDVMDAFSGYGRFKLLSKGEIDATLRDLRGQGQQIAKIEDMNDGKAPLKTGLQRRIPSDVERELIRVVNETKAKGEYKITNPDTQLRSRLQQWKATVGHRITDLERRLANKDYTGRKPLPPMKMDPEALGMQAHLERIKKDWYAARLADQLANRSLWQKAADRFVRWERAFKLSSPVVFGKLTAAAMTRGVTTLTEEAIGGAISRIPGISRVASQAPREGGLNVRAMAKAAASAFNKGLDDAAQTARKGAADIDVVYGEKIIDKDWANLFGQLHGMMKAPVKRAEFTLALEKRMQHAINHGVDVTDPAVQMRLSVEALNDGYRSIFMQRGFASDTFNQMVTMMEKSKRFPVQGEIAARAARFFFPIVRVPLNIVSETMTGVHGLATASARTMFHAINGTLDTLPPEVADSIMRQFKKGSIGAGLIAIGYLNADNIGGYNWREKRKAGDVKAAQFRVGGVNIPRWMTHAPWFELMSFGATINRTMRQHVAHTNETRGIPDGMMMAGLGLLEETPFLGQMARVDQMFTPAGRTQYLGELAKSTLIPQAVSWSAAQMDKPVPFHPLQDTRSRKPTNILEHVEMGIPGLRQNVPIKVEKPTSLRLPTFNTIQRP